MLDRSIERLRYSLTSNTPIKFLIYDEDSIINLKKTQYKLTNIFDVVKVMEAQEEETDGDGHLVPAHSTEQLVNLLSHFMHLASRGGSQSRS